jgi:peptidoglycan hydrolase-like protein with peptidoglycan-binding domain
MMTGSDVVICQQILKNNGYNIGKCGCDGKYGQDTVKAVKQFQTEHGLYVDGKVGVNTWAMLEKYD